MQKIVALLGLLAAAHVAAAQETRPASLFGRRPQPLGQPRPETRPASRPLAQPGGYCPTERSVDVVRVAADAIAAVQFGRYVWAMGQAQAPDYASYSQASTSTVTGRFGLKAGLNLANVTGVRDFDTKPVVGFAAGVMADFDLSDHFSFHPELLYSQKGAKTSVSDPSGASFSEDERVQYLDLPLLLRAKASGFFLEAGPQLGYLLAHKSEQVEVVPGLGSFPTTDNSTDGTRRLDVGYVVGLGYALPQGLEVGVRYNGGLADVQDPSTDPKLRNSVFQLQVGYLFGSK
jgi:hypothetical protein